MILKLPKNFITKSFSLKNYGFNEIGWERNDALEVIDYLYFQNCITGILGGDVYLINNKEIDCLGDNWSSKERENESYFNFKKRSLFESKKYIEEYPIKDSEKIIFVFVFSEIVELDI